MFYPVTIYNAEGKIKKVLSTKILHEKYWRRFRETQRFSAITKSRKPERPKGLKEKPDMEFPGIPVRHRQ